MPFNLILGEYGGPLNALKHGDFKSVFVFAEPQKIPQHNFYELIWLLKTGAPRIVRPTMLKSCIEYLRIEQFLGPNYEGRGEIGEK